MTDNKENKEPTSGTAWKVVWLTGLASSQATSLASTFRALGAFMSTHGIGDASSVETLTGFADSLDGIANTLDLMGMSKMSTSKEGGADDR